MVSKLYYPKRDVSIKIRQWKSDFDIEKVREFGNTYRFEGLQKMCTVDHSVGMNKITLLINIQ